MSRRSRRRRSSGSELAQRVDVRGVPVKIRRPWGVFFLTLLTLGIYYLVWYYRINKELNGYGAALGPPNQLEVSPGWATVAISLGALLIVPPFVSIWRTFARIGKAEQLAGVEERINHGLAFLLYIFAIFFLPFELVYGQAHLNRVWRLEAAEEQARLSGMRGEPAAF